MVQKLTWLLVAALLAAAGWYVHDNALRKEREKWQTRLFKQETEANALLETERDKREAVEKSMAEVLREQEGKDHENTLKIVDLRQQLRDARLRNAAAATDKGGVDKVSADQPDPGDRGEDTAEGVGLFSELLAETLFEADAINVAYASCRADAIAVRKALQEYQDGR